MNDQDIDALDKYLDEKFNTIEGVVYLKSMTTEEIFVEATSSAINESTMVIVGFLGEWLQEKYENMIPQVEETTF